MDSVISHLGICPEKKKKKNHGLTQGCSHKDIQSVFACSSKKTETTKCPALGGWINSIGMKCYVPLKSSIMEEYLMTQYVNWKKTVKQYEQYDSFWGRNH